MIVVPAETPVTIPEEDPMVATPVLLLVHVPEPLESTKVNIPPVHRGPLL